MFLLYSLTLYSGVLEAFPRVKIMSQFLFLYHLQMSLVFQVLILFWCQKTNKAPHLWAFLTDFDLGMWGNVIHSKFFSIPLKWKKSVHKNRNPLSIYLFINKYLQLLYVWICSLDPESYIHGPGLSNNKSNMIWSYVLEERWGIPQWMTDHTNIGSYLLHSVFFL